MKTVPTTARNATIEGVTLKAQLFSIQATGCWEWTGSHNEKRYDRAIKLNTMVDSVIAGTPGRAE